MVFSDKVLLLRRTKMILLQATIATNEVKHPNDVRYLYVPVEEDWFIPLLPEGPSSIEKNSQHQEKLGRRRTF
jgi:hypothetical protein